MVETRSVAILVSHEVHEIKSLLLITGLTVLLRSASRDLLLLLLVRIIVHVVDFCGLRMQRVQIHVRVHRTRVKAH